MERIAGRKTLRRNETGFSLVEVMVAIVIVMVGLLGLVQMTGVAATHNIKNQLRDEAVLLGEEEMAKLFSLPESQIVAFPFQTFTTASRLRGTTKKYTITRRATKVTASSSYLFVINVGWTYKDTPGSHEVQVMRTF